MERTPFDDPNAPQDDAFDEFDEAEFEDADEQFEQAGDETDEEYEETGEADEAPAPRALPRWFLPALGIIVLVLIMVGGGIWAGKRAENERLAELRERVNAIVRNDNALVLEVLNADESQNITYAEFFNRTAKNKTDRDTLIRKLRTMVAPSYQAEIDNLVSLMEIENEYVRAEESVTRQKLEVASRHDALEEIAEANDAGLNSPYVPPSGDEYNQQSLEVARRAGAAFRKYKVAREAMALKLNAAETAIDNWLDNETKLYPQWAPARDVIDALQAKKRRYNIAAPDPGAQPDSPINPAPDAPSGPEFVEPPLPEPEPTLELAPEPSPLEPEQFPDEQDVPEPTPDEQATPATGGPIRDEAPGPLAGERFGQTRFRDLSEDELRVTSDDDLRYMINEMFARYGQTFGDKNYQAQFEQFGWYKPDARWSSSKIRRAFNEQEKRNLKALTRERERRKQEGRGY